jgi:hypothetical protein
MFDPWNRSRWNSEVRFRVDDGGARLIDRSGTLLLPMRRERLLRYLPSQARVAEIGVARGRFSAQIKSTCQPLSLTLIDPWLEQDTSIYGGDGNNAAQTEQDRRFQRVSRRFASRQCQILRKFSADAAGEFDDGSLDWVYIDGNHSYDACLEDLRLWAAKVKNDGLILGHDFVPKFGVVEAVRDFIGETGFEVAALTVEHFPTYVIAKAPDGAALSRFRNLLFSYEKHLIQIPSIAGAEFEHTRIHNGIPRSGFVHFSFGDLASARSGEQHQGQAA